MMVHNMLDKEIVKNQKGKSRTEFGEKFIEHFGIISKDNIKLYNTEYYWYKRHKKVPLGEIMNYLISIQKEDPNTTYEWYEYHKKFSFDKIVVFNNSTNKLTIDYIDVSKMKAPQPMCYQWFYDNVAEYGDTITVLDADEFLTSDKTIQDIWADFDLTVDCIRFSWQIFGNSAFCHSSSLVKSMC